MRKFFPKGGRSLRGSSDATSPTPKASPAPPAPADAAEDKRMIPCRHHLNGHCRNGAHCDYLHLPRSPSHGSPQSGGSDRFGSGTFDGSDDIPSSDDGSYSRRSGGGRSNVFCQFFMAGYCRDGDNCPNRHYVDGAPHDHFSVPPENSGGGRRLGTRADDSRSRRSGPPLNVGQIDVDNMTYEELLALEEQMGKAEQPRAQAEIALRSLPVIPFVTPKDMSEISSENIQCLICITEYSEGEEFMLLPCLHRFHVPCMREWALEGKPECPICKQDIRKSGSGMLLQPSM